ncbi:MAG: endonuclease domain-containing protein [Chitinophagaceae bacterium]|nr:endonuclease domain-containing protein [Chitinophagaceae bacterium]
MESKMHRGAQKPLFQMAREHRNNATHAEEILWNYLKTKPFSIKFRRQHPYSAYILDFYCHSLKLVIEVDGSIHDLEEVKRDDIQRQRSLENDGLMVIRFSNDQVKQFPEKVFEDLNILIQKMIDDKKR